MAELPPLPAGFVLDQQSGGGGGGGALPPLPPGFVLSGPAQGPLSNSADDSSLSSAAKGLGTAAIKGVGNTLGFVGNLGNFSDYLLARAQSKITGRPVEDVLADFKKNEDKLPGVLKAVNPRNVFPSGADISDPILAKTGEYVPTSTAGKIAQGGAEAAFGALGPGAGGAAGAGRQILAAAPGLAAGNAIAGGTGEAVTDLTGDPLLGLAAGLGGAGAAQGAAAAARGVFPAVGPGAAARVEGAAGGRLLEQSSDPAALRDWAAQPDTSPEVAGTQRTTAGALGNDRGLFQAEKDARNVNNIPFNERDRAQSEAQAGAIRGMQPDGDVFAPGQMIRQRMDAIDAAAQEAEDRLSAAHQDAATQRTMGSANFADRVHSDLTERTLERGQVSGDEKAQSDAARQAAHDRLVQSFQDAQSKAEQAARAGAAGLGERANLEETGSTLRSAMEDVRGEVKKVHRDLYNAVDPEGKLALVATPVRDKATGIADQLKADGSEFDSVEAGLFRRAQSLPEVIPYRMLHTLDKDISAAMSKERRGAGETPALARLVQLKGAVKDAMVKAADNQAQHEARMVQSGLMSREDSLEARLQDAWQASGTDGLSAGFREAPSEAPRQAPRPPPAAKTPQSALGYMRSLGGVKDTNGDLAAKEIHRAFPGLVNNRSGMSRNDMLRNLKEAGYLPSDADLGDLHDLIEDHPRYSAFDTEDLLKSQERGQWLEDERRLGDARGEVRSFLDENGGGKTDPEWVEIAAKHVLNGEDVETSLERAAIEHENALSQDRYHAALSNSAPQGTTDATGAGAFGERTPEGPPAEGIAPEGDFGGIGAQRGLEPNFSAEAAQRLKAANSAYAGYAQTYKNPIIAPGLRTTGYSGQYRMPDAVFIKRAIQPGEKGFETVNAHLAAVKDNPTAVAAMQSAILDPLRRTAQAEGVIHPNALARWKESYGPALRGLERVAPGFSANFDDAAHATQSLLDIGAQHKQDLAAFQRDSARQAVIDNLARREKLSEANAADRAQAKALLAERASDDAAHAAQSKAATAAGIAAARGAVKEARATPAGQFAAQGGDRIAPAEVENAVGNLLKTGTSGATRMKSLVESVSGNEDALAGLRKAGVDWIIRTHQTADGSLSGAKFINFIKNNRDVLGELYPDHQISMFAAISRDIEANAKWRTETAIKGGSDTAKNVKPMIEKALDQGRRHISIMAAATAGFLTGGLKGAAAGASLYLLNSLHEAGIRRIDDLYREALLNPEVAKLLISKMPETAEGSRLKQLVGLLRRSAIVGPMLTDSRKR